MPVSEKWIGRVILLLMFVPWMIFSGCGPHRVKPVRNSSRKVLVLSEKVAGPGYKPYVIHGEKYYPLPDSEGFVEYGKASWYGKKFHGRPTASGEIFDMHRKTAAHKTLPLGTYVKILNLSNRRQVVVKITDRGPFVKGRIIDLSYAAAKQIGLIGPGVADVKIVALGKEVGEIASPQGSKPLIEISDLNRGEFTVQVGAFRRRENAVRLSDRLKVIFDYVDIEVVADGDAGPIYRVRVSKSKTLSEAGKLEKRLGSMGFEGAFIVRL